MAKGWRIPSGLIVEPARENDLGGIMEVESEAWGEGVGEDAAASLALMKSRIELCNSEGPPFWFLTAKYLGIVQGYVLIQPTFLAPENCTGWDQATDNGTMRRYFDRRGPYIYGVSFAVRRKAHPMSAEMLVLAGHGIRMATEKHVFYLCSRMPGFAEANAQTGISPGDYWKECRPDGSPKDPMLNYFWNTIGVSPERLLLNGYPPDLDSGGHAVLCVTRNPYEDAIRTSVRLSWLCREEET